MTVTCYISILPQLRHWWWVVGQSGSSYPRMVFVHWILRRNYFVASLSTMIYRCIIYILMYNMSTKSYYWWSYGSAKFCFETRHRSIKFRRAITSSISIRWRQFLYWNVSHDPLYRHCDLEVSKQRGRESRHNMVAWCKICYVYVRSIITLSI